MEKPNYNKLLKILLILLKKLTLESLIKFFSLEKNLEI